RGMPVLDSQGNEINTTQRYSKKIGATLKSVKGTSASYDLTGKEIYVRAVVRSSKLHPNPSEIGEVERAWVQPVAGPAAPQE
ncbi:MAG TPA: hypothetical protein DDZ90_04470, partial [Planctomycetaceae bacterium]|nr:hypothetical protein [Planctomycetaceae bacterium]